MNKAKTSLFLKIVIAATAALTLNASASNSGGVRENIEKCNDISKEKNYPLSTIISGPNGKAFCVMIVPNMNGAGFIQFVQSKDENDNENEEENRPFKNIQGKFKYKEYNAMIDVLNEK